jgi:hypothetical protein
MKENRKLMRQHLLAEVKIKPGGAADWTQAVLTNINRGGIGLYAMGSLKESERVAVRISYLDDGKVTEVEEVPGTVRWAQTIGESTAAGIGFDETITNALYPILDKCLEHIKSD